MSGGHYGYKDRELGYLADAIDEDLERARAEGKPEPEVVEAAMQYCVKQLRSLTVLLRAIDYYQTGDSGAEAVKAIFQGLGDERKPEAGADVP